MCDDGQKRHGGYAERKEEAVKDLWILLIENRASV